MLRLLLPSLLLFLATPARAQLEAGWHDDQTLSVGEQIRHFRYFVPAANAELPRPAVIYLHGGGSSMRRSMPPNVLGSARWPAVAEANGFLLLLPNGVNVENGDTLGDDQHWNDCRADAGAAASDVDDVAFLDALLAWVVDELGVDPGRIYLSGASNGGMMAYRYAQQGAERPAAMAVFVANQPANSECPPPARGLPVLIMNGTADPLMPFTGGMVAGSRGRVLSAEATRDLWLALNGLEAVAPQSLVYFNAAGDDGGTVQLEVYRGGPERELRFYRVRGGGHAIPSVSLQIGPLREQVVGRQNHDIEGVDEAWAFLRRFEREPLAPGSISGLWFDPSRDGEGFNVIAGEAGLVVFFFGYDEEGRPLWLVSETLAARPLAGAMMEFAMFQASAGSFDQPVASSESLEPWGQLRLDFIDCTRARFELEGDHGATKSVPAIRLLGVGAPPLC